MYIALIDTFLHRQTNDKNPSMEAQASGGIPLKGCANIEVDSAEQWQDLESAIMARQTMARHGIVILVNVGPLIPSDVTDAGHRVTSGKGFDKKDGICLAN